MVSAIKPKPKYEESLRQRLGNEAYERRLRVEDGREKEFHCLLSDKFTFFKRHIIRPIQKAIFKITGLYKKGYSELLSPVISENFIYLGSGLPEEFNQYRILHLSDLHIDMDDRLVEALSNAISKVNYDICVMTGDYRNLTVGVFDETIKKMAILRKSIKTDAYLVLGNHDFLAMAPELENLGYKVLLNENIQIEKSSGARLSIVGVDDPVIYKTDDIIRATNGIDENTIKILLAHSPRIFDKAANAKIDLLLAGHTHGGQICLPNGRHIIRNDIVDDEMLQGPWQYKDLKGYTSRGCGACGLPMRLNCPPELAIHILLKSQS